MENINQMNTESALVAGPWALQALHTSGGIKTLAHMPPTIDADIACLSLRWLHAHGYSFSELLAVAANVIRVDEVRRVMLELFPERIRDIELAVKRL